MIKQKISVSRLGKVLFILCFISCLGTLCFVTLWDNPYSLLYKYRQFDRDTRVSQLLLKNRERFNQSKNYLKLIDPEGYDTETGRTRAKEMVFAVITVSRKYKSSTMGYLTQAVTSVHMNIRSHDAEIVICNTDLQPSQHTEVVALSKHFTIYNRFQQEGVNIVDMAKPNHPVVRNSLYTIENGYSKEKDDYLFCLEKLLQHKTQLMVVLEDDAIIMKNFFEDLQKIIIPKLNYYYPKWGYVKLYYPPKWQGYANERARILDLLYTAFRGALALTMFFIIFKTCTMCSQFRLPNAQRFLLLVKSKQLPLVLILGFFASLLFIVIIGRQNVLELERFFHHYRILTSSGCCTPAIMYKPQVAEAMVNHLRNVNCTEKYPFDIAQEDFRKNKTVEAFLIEPSLVRHIGLVSAIKGKGLKGDLNEFVQN